MPLQLSSPHDVDDSSVVTGSLDALRLAPCRPRCCCEPLTPAPLSEQLAGCGRPWRLLYTTRRALATDSAGGGVFSCKSFHMLGRLSMRAGNRPPAPCDLPWKGEQDGGTLFDMWAANAWWHCHVIVAMAISQVGLLSQVGDHQRDAPKLCLPRWNLLRLQRHAWRSSSTDAGDTLLCWTAVAAVVWADPHQVDCQLAML